MRKSVLRITAFLIILLTVLFFWNEVFKFKFDDGIYGMKTFYGLEDDTVDVLILGSSHAYDDFNTGTLWDEYGMSAYMLGASIQPMWNTYYYLKEALKTQHPKLIVLEGFCTVLENEYVDDSRIIKNNFGLKWSGDKIDSVKVSSPKEELKEYFLEYIQYHKRYTGLSRADFLSYQGDPMYRDWKGFTCNMATAPYEAEDVSGVTGRTDLYEKTEKYYRAILELAKDNDIPIIVVITPYSFVNEDYQRKFNRAGDIAEEMGVPFLNCNNIVDEIGIDYSTDAADGAHLNYRGNQKFSSFIGQYLKDMFDIPDHRGDPDYDSWERHAAFIGQMIYDQEIRDMNDADEIFARLGNGNYLTVISLDGTCSTSDGDIRDYLEASGINEKDAQGIWLFQGGKRVWHSGTGTGEYFIETYPHDFHMVRTENANGTITDSVIIDREEYLTVENGINVVIYDNLTEKIVDSFGLNKDEGYDLVRNERG